MKINIYLGIAFRVIILFSIGMLMAYVKPQLHAFLGDTVHVCKSDHCHHAYFIDDGYDWGAMHFWFFWMCIFLFILSLINCIVYYISISTNGMQFNGRKFNFKR